LLLSPGAIGRHSEKIEGESQTRTSEGGDQRILAISFTKRVLMPSDVLTCELDRESVLLNLKSERYFGLDEVGSRMWKVLTRSESIQAAYQALLAEYAVDPEQLSRDLEDFIEKLLGQGLIEVRDG
jgi:hypothetical protein